MDRPTFFERARDDFAIDRRCVRRLFNGHLLKHVVLGTQFKPPAAGEAVADTFARSNERGCKRGLRRELRNFLLSGGVILALGKELVVPFTQKVMAQGHPGLAAAALFIDAALALTVARAGLGKLGGAGNCTELLELTYASRPHMLKNLKSWRSLGHSFGRSLDS